MRHLCPVEISTEEGYKWRDARSWPNWPSCLFLTRYTKTEEPKKPLKIMMKSAWGPDDPTRAAFPFAHGLALAEAGHEVQIFLLAEATSLMRKSMANAILPMG